MAAFPRKRTRWRMSVLFLRMYLRQNSHMYSVSLFVYSSGNGEKYHVSISNRPSSMQLMFFTCIVTRQTQRDRQTETRETRARERHTRETQRNARETQETRKRHARETQETRKRHAREKNRGIVHTLRLNEHDRHRQSTVNTTMPVPL